MGLHFDYKSKAGERAMEKERKRQEKLAAKKAKEKQKRSRRVSRIRALTDPNAPAEEIRNSNLITFKYINFSIASIDSDFFIL